MAASRQITGAPDGSSASNPNARYGLLRTRVLRSGLVQELQGKKWVTVSPVPNAEQHDNDQ